MSIPSSVTLAVTEDLRIAAAGSAFIVLTVIAMLAGQFLLDITRKKNGA